MALILPPCQLSSRYHKQVAAAVASGKKEKKKKKLKGTNYKLPQAAWTGVKAGQPGHFRIISTAVAAATAAVSAVSRPVKGDMQLGPPH